MISSEVQNGITSQEIIEQKDKICLSRELSSKPILCRLLDYLVEATLAGNEEKLKGYTIGVELFGKEENFDAEQNPLVRIHAGRLRRILSMYYLQTGKDDPIRIEIPKGQYVPHFIAHDTADIIAGNKYGRERLIKPTVAILPFGNLSGDPAKDYFSLGFSEELSVELIKFEDLTVFESMSLSSESLSDEDKYKSILEKDIRFIVEGSVQLTDNQIKVLVKLTDLTRREQIWAERYLKDLSASNLIEIQENIINDISGILGSEYGIILQRLSDDLFHEKPQHLETFHAISRFYYFEATQTQEAFTEAFKALEQAVKNDPDSGLANAMLAVMHGNRYMLGMENADPALLKANELLETAIRLEPNCLTVRVINAFRYFLNNDKSRFLQEVEKCLSKNPQISHRLGSLGFYLSLFGEWNRGKTILDKVMHSSIRFPLYYYGATTLYYYREMEYEKALKEVLNYDIPPLFWGPLLRVAVMGQLNMASEARSNIEHLLALKPEFEDNARYLISICVKEDDLAEHILEGLQKAGMRVQ
jgi:adenylate cyclase